MKLTDALLVLIFLAVLVDIRYTRKWLAAAESMHREMQKQARAFLDREKPSAAGPGEETP